MKILIIAALTVFAEQPVADDPWPPSGEPAASLFESAARLLDERLLDYPSARFRAVRADQNRVCGFVNAKNAVGAYSGWKAFGVLGENQVWIDDAYMIEPFCTPALLATRTDYSDRLTHR